MWKKEEVPGPVAAPSQAQPEPQPRVERHTPAMSSSAERATIGRSITIRGEVTGDEDLLIQGRVEGSVDLKQHSVTVGAEGEVKASIAARVVMVEGRVEGNISAEEQVILRSSAAVQGDISAPRVVLEDGAKFRGGVDMGDVVDRTRKNTNQSASRRGSEAGNGMTVDAATVAALPDKAKSGAGARAEITT